MQAMWSDTLDSDTVKNFVELATVLIKIVDTVGPLNIALVGFIAYMEKKHGVLSDFFKPAGDGVDTLKKQLEQAEKDLAKATDADLQHGNKKTAQKRRDTQERVNILRQQIADDEPKIPVGPELDALIGDRDTLTQDINEMKARREALQKAMESDSEDNLLRLVQIDMTSIDDEIAETKDKLTAAQQTFALELSKPDSVYSQDRASTSADEIVDLEDRLFSLELQKEATIRGAALFDLAEMDTAIGEASKKLDGVTAAINAKTMAQNADNSATVAGVTADKMATDAKVDKTAATWKELGAQIMSGDVTKANIGASIKNILVTKLASTALGEKMAAILGVTTAELVNIPVTQLLTAGFSALAGAIWAVLAPLLPFIAIAAGAVVAVVALVKVIDNVWVTAGEAKEKLEELNSEINDLESDIQSLNEELETTQNRMEELLSKESLSFTEQEELDNLKLQNKYLEKQIELQELVLQNKKAARLSTAKDVIGKTWNSKSYGKEDYQVDFDDGVIKKDNFWSVGRSGKDAIEEGLKRYKQTELLLSGYEQGYISNLEKFGSEHSFTKQAKENVEATKDLLTRQAGGINMVLEDMSNIIAENELKYGTDDEVNKFIDEYYAMTLKWQEAQGIAGKSDIIKHIFNDETSEDIKNLKAQLDEIASSELDDAEKQTQAQKLIQDALADTNGDYQRLQTTVKTLNMSAEELAKSFIAMSHSPDIGTIGGILEIFADGEEIIKSKSTELQLGIDEAGESITWDSLFKGLDGKKTADNLKVASILEGADKSVRDQFIKLIEEVENGKTNVDEALSKWKMVGVDKAVETLNTEFEALNNEMFPDAADEISGLIDTLGELKSAFESVANTMDTFKSAQEENNDTGRISIKTAIELMESTDNWDKILNITEDSISLVKGAEEELMKSQLESIGEQMQTAADMAKIKLEAAVNAQKAKQAFEAEANAANNLSTTEQSVNATQQNANVTTQQRTGAMGDLAVQTYGTAISELDYAANDDTVQTAESVKAKAIGLVSAAIVGLDSFIDALLTDKTMKEAWSEYQEARNVVVNDANSKTTTVDALREDYKKKQTMANLAANGDTYDEFSKNWSKEDADSQNEEANDAFKKEMEYWENRIAANQAKYEQLQNEIDLLEKKGQKADKDYYLAQGMIEEDRLSLLESQKAAALSYLKTFEEGSEEWWEVADVLNGIENEIDSVTASLVDLQDAIGEIDAYKFEEFNNRLDDITSQLGTIRDLMAPNGEEDWFDDEGQWTEVGVAVLGSYIQELETYKQGLEEVQAAYSDYVNDYVGNEKQYAKIGIHSEQELYDKRQELIEQQYDYAESISDTEQSVVDMYESNIDAIEEYTEKLVDNYNDYIDSVKEALDAERDLYKFKKDIQKQTKDIATIERRIASLSGSTNAADIAERRKLEKDLYESRESLNDTYYDHAKDAQTEALDAEAEAYEETMTTVIRGLRTSLEDATQNMDEFLMGVTSMVMYNADTVLSKYEDTNLPLTKELTNPWEEARTAVGNYSGDALDLMNQWVQNGFLTTFPETVTSSLTSPWEAGQTAATAFQVSIDNVMAEVVKSIETNVVSASGQLESLLKDIQATERMAAQIQLPGGIEEEDENPVVETPVSTPTTPKRDSSTIRETHPTRPTFKKVTGISSILAGVGQTGLNIGSKTYTAAEFNSLQVEGGDGIYFPYTAHGAKDKYVKKGEGYSVTRSGSKYKLDFHSLQPLYQKYAKGTMGTARDGFAITDEPQFGDELTMYATPEGTLSFMRAGSTVVPADITANLVEWGKLNPDMMSINGTPNINMISNAVNKPEIVIDVENFLKVDRVDKDTLPQLEAMMDKKIDTFARQLNYSIKKFSR